MTNQTRVTVDGAARLQSTLATAAEKVGHPDQALAIAGALVESRGRALVPRLTGALGNSITAQNHGAEVQVTAGADYAAVTEYGGGNNIPAQPFLRPALDASNTAIVAAFRADIVSALNHVKGA